MRPRSGSDFMQRLDTRNEIDAPLHAGALNLMPYATGRLTNWGDRPSDGDYNRAYGQVGLRANTHLWRVYNNASSRLLDVNRLRHIVTPEVPYSAVTSWTISQEGRNRILAAPATGSGTVYNGRIGYYWSVEWNRQDVTSGVVPKDINCMANAGKDGERVYATAANGLFVSKDQGKTFENLK